MCVAAHVCLGECGQDCMDRSIGRLPDWKAVLPFVDMLQCIGGPCGCHLRKCSAPTSSVHVVVPRGGSTGSLDSLECECAWFDMMSSS